MKKRNDIWNIYYDVNLDTRILVKRLVGKTKAEAEIEYADIIRKYPDKNVILENNQIKWWRIYRKTSAHDIETIVLFKAQSREKAYRTYLKYLKDNGLDGSDNYFYSTAFLHMTKNKSGEYKCMHSTFEFLDRDTIDRRLVSEYQRGYKKAEKEFRTTIEKDIPYFVKTGHSRSEWYNLGNHMLEDLIFNLPILIKNINGYPNEFNAKYGKDGFEKWKEELRKFYGKVMLFKYYSDYGIVDSKDKEMAKVDAEYRNTLPIFPGTETFDYRKLSKMQLDLWNQVIAWLKKWMLALWD